jgi:hypothetical protein
MISPENMQGWLCHRYQNVKIKLQILAKMPLFCIPINDGNTKADPFSFPLIEGNDVRSAGISYLS